MRIDINDQWRIITDPYQYILQHRNNSVTERWGPKGYYTSLAGVVNGLLEHDLKSRDVETLSDALTRLNKLHADVVNALLPEYQVLPDSVYQDLIKASGSKMEEVRSI